MANPVITFFVLVLMATTDPAMVAEFWNNFCVGQNYTANGQYERHIKELAATLPWRVAASPVLFAGGNAGSSPEEAIFAVAQCRGDSRPSICRRCVTRALEEAHEQCGLREGAIVFRDICTVGYYNKKIVWFPRDYAIDVPSLRFDSSPVMMNSQRFDAAVFELISTVANRAAAATPKHFATGRKEFVGVDSRLKLYAVAECWPTISATDCKNCLEDVMKMLHQPSGMTAGRAAKIWCSYRFAPYRFFRGHPMLNLSADPNGIVSSPAPEHHHRVKDIVFWVLVAVATTLAVGFALLLLVLYRWRKKIREMQSSGRQVEMTGRTGETALARAAPQQIESLPWALENFKEIVQLAEGKKIVLFLDYDGTLSPIVKDPERAFMSEEMRDVVKSAADLFQTSIVSGRARTKVFDFVRINQINYAGSHGMDIQMVATAESSTSTSTEITEEGESYQPAKEYQNVINKVFNSLVQATEQIKGASVENNLFCVSVHYRNVAEEDQPLVRDIVDRVLETLQGGLKLTFGHMVYEIRPPLDWNKGNAVTYLLGKIRLHNSERLFPIYIGDDLTDEDAFKVLREQNDGLGILVSEAVRETGALYTLKDPSEVMEFLKMLVKWKLEAGEN